VAGLCRVGFDAEDCLSDHWLRPLKGRPVPSGGRAPCPVCGTDRSISIQVRSGRVVWNRHACECGENVIGQAIAAAVACYRHPARRTRKPRPDLERVEALLLDKSVPPNALRIGGLLALGKNMTEILRELKIPRSTYYDAVRILGQKPRSPSVRILGQDARASGPNSRTQLLARRVGKAV
jgi:hypothetical protein